jgi:bacteriochlorophyll 4-vinyl reductase
VQEGREEPRYYPNRLARIYLVALADVMGSNGLAAVLNLARLGHLAADRPPDNLDREFSFEDFAAISQAIEDVYGQRGAKGLSLRAGKATFKYALEDPELMPGLSELQSESLPAGERAEALLRTMAEGFTRLSDQLTHLEKNGEELVLVIEQCPMCWGRRSEVPVCYMAAGMLEEGLRWVGAEKDPVVTETHCMAKGDDACAFVVKSRPMEAT